MFALAMPMLATLAAAQPQKNRAWTGQIAVGYSASQGIIDEFFGAGFTFAVGGTYQPKRSPVGAWAELGYNGFDVSDAILEQLDVGSGDMRIWSLSGGFLWSIRTKSPVDVYVSGGPGWYRQEVELVNPGLEVLPPGCAVWWDWCQPETPIPASDIVGSRTTTRFGYNGGFGLTFALESGSQIYVELKYHRIDTTKEPTEFIPLAVGYRW